MAGDVSAVEFDDRANHRKAETGAGQRTHVGAAVEALVDAADLIFGDADSRV